MVTKTETDYTKAIDLITKVATNNFGGVNSEYDSNNVVTIKYSVLGQGTLLSNLIEIMLDKEFPEMDYTIKMIPSYLKLEIRLS